MPGQLSCFLLRRDRFGKWGVCIRILLREKEPVGKEAKSTIYWDRIQILPKINHFEGSVETIRFQQISNHLIGGDSACPPEPPLRFAMVLYYLLGNYRSRGDATAAGGGALRAVPKKGYFWAVRYR